MKISYWLMPLVFGLFVSASCDRNNIDNVDQLDISKNEAQYYYEQFNFLSEEGEGVMLKDYTENINGLYSVSDDKIYLHQSDSKLEFTITWIFR